MKFSEGIRKKILSRNTRYAANTDAIFKTLTPLTEAVCAFMKCDPSLVTWMDMMLAKDGGIIVSADIDESFTRFKETGNMINVLIPGFILEDNDPEKFIKYLSETAAANKLIIDEQKLELEETQGDLFETFTDEKKTIH